MMDKKEMKTNTCNTCRCWIALYSQDIGICNHPNCDHTGHVHSFKHECSAWEAEIMAGIDIHEVRATWKSRDETMIEEKEIKNYDG